MLTIKSYLQSIHLKKRKKKLIHSKTLFTIPVDLEALHLAQKELI